MDSQVWVLQNKEDSSEFVKGVNISASEPSEITFSIGKDEALHVAGYFQATILAAICSEFFGIEFTVEEYDGYDMYPIGEEDELPF